ncbi:MAG: hypothetical protein KC496_13750 [Anaerolineae bacterium]|nr:hypothetical protein [Anaerolineae bacterium]
MKNTLGGVSAALAHRDHQWKGNTPAMDVHEIAVYCKLPVELVAYFLSMPPAEVYRDEQYIRALYRLDLPRLRMTLPIVRSYYHEHLDDFAQYVEQTYHIDRGAMSAQTLGNWVVAFLDYPENALSMLEKHSHLPSALFDGGLEELLRLVEGLPEARDAWQQALCLLAFPLMHRS